ncbi:MAG: hypothetical protein CMD58_04520 [Gammaproteobacteria bacterium]|nr:hypothetical protein [Gammaproteobacteria bacterium]|tara:strand:+ start:412 stop:969 length:558 start_codon:yes stop_codon:yes gene_type:complete
MKNIFKNYILTILFIASPLFALEGVAVINLQQAVLGTQAAADAFKALEEEAEYAANVEQVQTLNADRQAIAEKLQKDRETLSQDEILEMEKEFAEKGQDIQFIAGKIQQAQQEVVQQLFNDLGQSVQRIVGELVAAKQIKLLLEKPVPGQQTTSPVLNFDPSLDLTDDVTSMLDVAAAEAPAQSD